MLLVFLRFLGRENFDLTLLVYLLFSFAFPNQNEFNDLYEYWCTLFFRRKHKTY